jgi:hypothetical protein
VSWFQGPVGASCDAVCASVNGAACVAQGYWPLSYADFVALLSSSVDLSTCLDVQDLSTCAQSSCDVIYQGEWCSYGLQISSALYG